MKVDVGDSLALRDLADEDLAVLGECDHRRRGPRPLGIRDDGGLSALQDGNDGVRRAEVDAYGSCHCVLPPTDGVLLSGSRSSIPSARPLSTLA